jgi:inorganic triphosphatase YgiF
MNENQFAAERDAASEEGSVLDIETLSEQVWDDLAGRISRSTIRRTIPRLLAKYDDAVIRRYVPLLVRREARELLGTAVIKETEAKFAVTDPRVFWRLQAVGHLAGYLLSPPRAKPVWDTYQDTRQRHILAAGYSCRRRETPQDIVIALKSLGRAEGAVHRRQEWQVRLTGPQQPIEWTDSPVRDRVLTLIGQEPLLPLFDLRQTRMIRVVQRDGQPVAELSLDSVTLTTGRGDHLYRELDVELLPYVPEAILDTITACLQDEWNLRPEPQSKFERALAVLDTATAGNEPDPKPSLRDAGVLPAHGLA